MQTDGKRDAVGNLIRRRWYIRLSVGASILALLAISLGFAAASVSGYVAAALPFALFS